MRTLGRALFPAVLWSGAPCLSSAALAESVVRTGTDWLLLALLGLATLVVVQSARLWVARRRARWRLARHRRRGARGEELAEQLLGDAGYEVEARQVTARYELFVDEQPRQITLRADFIVRRGERQFVAEAKAGELAARLETAATRRQLIEYCLAFDVEGVLLVDGERRRISLVQLERLRPPPKLCSGRVLLAVVATGILVAVAGFLYLYKAYSGSQLC